MLTLAEIGPALYGAWRLAHFDPDGLRYFDRSIRGFWRSFRVAVLVAPLWFAPIALAPVHLSDGWFRFTVAEMIGYAIQWFAYPLVAFYLVRLVNRQQEYFLLITALNWFAVIQLGFQSCAQILAELSLVPAIIGEGLVSGTLIAALVYEWFITRTVLRLTGFGAVGFVAVDLLIGSVVSEIAATLAHIV